MEVDMVPFIFGSFTRKKPTTATTEDSSSTPKRRSSENVTDNAASFSLRRAKYRQFRIENSKMQCDLCNQDYVQPRTLPCLHTFCTNCLIRQTVLSQASTQQQTPSAEAQVRWQLENEKAGRLGSSGHNESLNGSGSGGDSEPGSSCSSENPNRSASIICPTCGFDCKLSHDGVFALPLHGLLQNRVMANQEDLAYEICVAENLETCHIHPGRELIMFCTRCNQLACKDCWIILHRGHTCDTVNHFMSLSIPILNEAIAKTKTTHKEVALSISRLQSLEDRIQKRSKEVEAEVDRFFVSYKRAIDEHRTNLHREIAQIRQAKLDQVQSQKEMLTGRASHTSEAVAFTQDLLADASDTEVLILLNTVLGRLEWCVKNAPVLGFRVSDCIQFLPEERATVIRTHPIHGVVTTQAISPYHCIIESDGFARCRQHKLCELILLTRDCDKQPVCHGGANISAKLKYVDATSRSVPVDIKDSGDGTYILSFNPDSPGALRLSVTVQEKYIQGSPFTVNVQTVKPHTGVFHCCTFCSSNGSKQVACGCNGRMTGYKGCGHGHIGHPGRRHWSCCGNILQHSECSLYTSVFSTSSVNCSEVPVK